MVLLLLGSGSGRGLDGFLKRCKRRGLCEKELPSVTQIDDADNIFFADILKNNQHVLQTFLPDRTLLQYQLRQRSHNKIMISKTADLNDRDFIVRMLYKDSYYYFLNFYCFGTFFLQLFYSFFNRICSVAYVNCL